MDVTRSPPDSQPSTTTTTNRKRNQLNMSNTLLASATLFDTYLQDCQQQPSSPASSSTSQTTGDTTFEPSIDMMVNDFDDEQTLTEEEALAELEAQDPADEIATLQRESEMPIELLIAQYKHVAEDYHQRKQNRKKSMKKNRSRKHSKKHPAPASTSSPPSSMGTTTIPMTTLVDDEIIVIEESDEEVELMKTEVADVPDAGDEEDNGVCEGRDEQLADDDDVDEDEGEFGDEEMDEVEADVDIIHNNRAADFSKRSHLLELYPEKFASIQQKLDDEQTDDEDDDDDDSDYIKKTIMVGSAYQATIPLGLSKYGDVLPYENEDKLIWEPSQVSEQEVEDYLIRVREIKSTLSTSPVEEEIPSSSASVTSESDQGLGSNLIKDDEQALHLLVQCGYNFKEALRRKRLNAVPLTGSMSLWSEEECRNFEEGIQKYGKDFRKIRQTLVRTRSIRELVQFYYLWKKTDRRDQDFVDSDTIDHMDVYLDFDERDTGSNGGGKHISSSLINDSLISTQTFPLKKQHHVTTASSTLSNFSIMNESKRVACGNTKKSSHSKKSHGGGASATADQATTQSAYRRRSSLLAANKAHHHIGENAFVDTSSSTSNANLWVNSSTNNATASSTISSTTGNHCSKK